MRVDALRRGREGEVADRRDAAVTDAEVGGVPWRTGAVDDVSVPDEDVEVLGGESGGDGEKGQKSAEQVRLYDFSAVTPGFRQHAFTQDFVNPREMSFALRFKPGEYVVVNAH